MRQKLSTLLKVKARVPQSQSSGEAFAPGANLPPLNLVAHTKRARIKEPQEQSQNSSKNSNSNSNHHQANFWAHAAETRFGATCLCRGRT